MRLIDAEEVYKILESCEIRKATIGNPLTDWEYGYNCGIERAESEIECAPTVEPTLYGYKIEHLAWIANVMQKEDVTPEEATQIFKSMQIIALKVVDSINGIIERTFELTETRGCVDATAGSVERRAG